MKNLFLSLFAIFPFIVYSQRITPDISARVDTTKKEINQIYKLYTAYLNSKPDSIYANPFWNKSEYNYYLQTKYLRIDRAANIMFYDEDALSFFKKYKPMVLQIDSIGFNKYQIRTIFVAENPPQELKKYSIPYITTIYSSRNTNGEYKLENCINKLTTKWKRIKTDFITYIIHPNCNFDKKEAIKAALFCKKISNRFNIKIIPFKYYVLPNTDELGKLYNFEYWTYYIGAQSNQPLHEIFTTYGNCNYPHEFVHLLFSLNDRTPQIIKEGLATWLGGVRYRENFEITLKNVSVQLKQYASPSIEDIVKYRIRNPFDNNILYVTGAVICKLAYETKGQKAIWELYNSTNETLNSVMEKIFEKPIKNIEQMVIKYIIAQK